MAWVIDRFERDCAVIEDTGTLELFSVSRAELPPLAKERDVITKNPLGGYEIDAAVTAKRSARITRLLDRIKKEYH